MRIVFEKVFGNMEVEATACMSERLGAAEMF